MNRNGSASKRRHDGGSASGPAVEAALVARAKQYLAENVDKTYVDVGAMARSLRAAHREYARRPEAAFCRQVEAAYGAVLRSYGLDDAVASSSGSADEDDDDDDSDDLEVLDEPDALNARLVDMYGRRAAAKAARREEKEKAERERAEKAERERAEKAERERAEKNRGGEELIDISSDDSSEDAPDASKPNEASTPRKAPTPPPLEEADTPPPQSKRRRPVKQRTPTKASLKSVPPELKYASKYTLDDVGGLERIAEQICDLAMHMKHPEVYAKLGIKAPRGALLHGPPGTGKTLLAHAIAGRLRLPIVACVATELVGGVSGDSEKKIRELFETASDIAPCVLFIDEIDAVCGNRLNAQKDMERRMVAQLLSSIDDLDDKGASVLLLAATNSPDNLDPGLRRAGRLEQEIALGIPTVSARRDILRILSRKLNLDGGVDLDSIAQLTPGYVGADLQALINKSCTVAVKRVFKSLEESAASLKLTNGGNVAVESVPVENNATPTEVVVNGEQEETAIVDVETVNAPDSNKLDQSANASEITQDVPAVNPVAAEETNLSPAAPASSNYDVLKKYLEDSVPFTAEQLADMKITQPDILTALKTTRPCALREGIITVPDTTWDDIGSLIDVRRDLQLAVLAPVKYPDQLSALGLTIPSGVLLCGPPGCGKTLLAKAVANEAGINFISVKGPELLNMYVGESERAVRTCFTRARNSSPCVIFFDEFDSLCPKRASHDSSGATRVVNQLLTEMDGVEGREGVFILAATNRPDIIDPAVLRPGRLDKVIFVGMPLLADRSDILRAITKKGTKPPIGADVDLEAVAKATEGYTGADLAGLVRQAATETLTDFITGGLPNGRLAVTAGHFRKALEKTKPSVSPKDMLHYEKLRLKYASTKDEKADVEMSDMAESMDTV